VLVLDSYIGQQGGGLQRAKIPGELLLRLILQVGHVMGEPAATKRITSRTNLSPQFGE
jgi:hypothetical protein